MKYIRVTTPLLLFLVSCGAGIAAAGESGILENPIKHDSITDLLLSVLSGVTIILIPIMILAIVVVGFKMVYSGSVGKPEGFKNHKNALLYALLGLFLVLGARGIIGLIQNTVGDVLDDTEPVAKVIRDETTVL